MIPHLLVFTKYIPSHVGKVFIREQIKSLDSHEQKTPLNHCSEDHVYSKRLINNIQYFCNIVMADKGKTIFEKKVTSCMNDALFLSL